MRRSRFNITANTVANVNADPNNGRSHGTTCAYSSGNAWRLSPKISGIPITKVIRVSGFELKMIWRPHLRAPQIETMAHAGNNDQRNENCHGNSDRNCDSNSYSKRDTQRCSHANPHTDCYAPAVAHTKNRANLGCVPLGRLVHQSRANYAARGFEYFLDLA
jgi:hypothetical protein